MEKDNAGLQCGDPLAPVHRILLALDATPRLVQEAIRRRADLLITHHPLLFRPVQKIDLQTDKGRIIRELLAHRIALVAAHTNLDFTEGGTSHALASLLGIQHVEFLHSMENLQKKIIVYVPASHADAVAEAMAGAGAGVIGDYEHCSFRVEGTGTFKGGHRSTPAIGRRGVFERVPETRIEMVAPSWRVTEILGAIRAVHPYEEPALDVIPTDIPERRAGMGVIGSLARPIAFPKFVRRVKRALHVPLVRCSGGSGRSVSRIAVCGGAGADLLDAAVAGGAEVFVTADVRYHSFHDAGDRILLLDAGHYETEFPVIPVVAERLQDQFRKRGENILVQVASTTTNPVAYV